MGVSPLLLSKIVKTYLNLSGNASLLSYTLFETFKNEMGLKNPQLCFEYKIKNLGALRNTSSA